MYLRPQLEFAYVFLPVGVLVGVTLALTVTSVAEDTELDTGPRAIPYNGLLKFNDQAISGQADLRFTLTDDPGGANMNCLYEEVHDNVTVYAGRFSVNIGSVGALPACVFDSEAMYIEVAVREATSELEADFVTLSGAQRIHPVPFAYWAAEGSDLKNDGDLSVTGDIEDPTDGIVNVNDNLSVTGALQGSNEPISVGVDLGVTGRAYVSSFVDEASLTTDGLLTLGEASGVNLTLDEDEIIARDNGASSTLTLQDGGGDTEARGDVAVHGVLRNFTGAPIDVVGDLGVTGNIHNPDGDTVTINDGLSVEGRLFINDLDINDDGTDGCARIGDMQVCWETYFSTRTNVNGFGVSFNWSKAFANTEYAVTATTSRATASFNGVTLASKSEGSIVASCLSHVGATSVCASNQGEDDLHISLIAFGKAGSDW